MSSDDYQVQSIYRYARKSYKNSHEVHNNCGFSHQDENVESESPKSDRAGVARCICPDREDDLASILHRKCPVITLARQQLQKVLDETDQMLSDHNRCCRTLYDFLYICRDICRGHNKCTCALIILMGIGFCLGLFFGAASCGSYLGRFNSPIMQCLENRFISETVKNMDEYHGIV